MNDSAASVEKRLNTHKSRADALDAAGKDTTEVREKLREAETKLAELQRTRGEGWREFNQVLDGMLDEAAHLLEGLGSDEDDGA